MSGIRDYFARLAVRRALRHLGRGAPDEFTAFSRKLEAGLALAQHTTNENLMRWQDASRTHSEVEALCREVSARPMRGIR